MQEIIKQLIEILLKAGIEALVSETEEDDHTVITFNDHKDEPTRISIKTKF